MKKGIRCLLLAFMMLFMFCVSVAAAEQTEAQLYYVTDAAGLLDENENMQLEKMAETVSKKYGVGVYIVTLEDYQDVYPNDVYKATYTIYHNFTMGEGPNRDGIMLLLSMNDRDWAMFCYGSRSEYAFNKYGQQELEKVFLDNFGENDWYGGFEDYIKECSVYLEKAASWESCPCQLTVSRPYCGGAVSACFIGYRFCNMAENGLCGNKGNSQCLCF